MDNAQTGEPRDQPEVVCYGISDGMNRRHFSGLRLDRSGRGAQNMLLSLVFRLVGEICGSLIWLNGDPFWPLPIRRSGIRYGVSGEELQR